MKKLKLFNYLKKLLYFNYLQIKIKNQTFIK